MYNGEGGTLSFCRGEKGRELEVQTHAKCVMAFLAAAHSEMVM